LTLTSSRLTTYAAVAAAGLSLAAISTLAYRGARETAAAATREQQSAALLTLQDAEQYELREGSGTAGTQQVQDAAEQLLIALDAVRTLSYDGPLRASALHFCERAQARATDALAVADSLHRNKVIAAGQTAQSRRLATDTESSLAALEEQERTTLASRTSQAVETSWLTVNAIVLLVAVFIAAAATIFGNLRRHIARLQRSNTELSFIRRFVDDLQLCATTVDTCAVAVEALRRTFPAARAGEIALLDRGRDSAEMVCAWGEQLQESTFRPDSCCALRRGSIFHGTGTGDALKCTHYSSGAHYIAFPLIAQGETIGVAHVRFPEPEAARLCASPEGHAFAAQLIEQTAIAVAGQRQRESLQAQSIKDPLTGAFNRRFMETTLERELLRSRRKSSQVGLVLVDLDHFKRLNDSHGHQAGDEILKSAVSVFTRVIRAEDIVCRYGGEEFAIILPDISADALNARAESIRVAVEQVRFEWNGRQLAPLTLSAGVAVSSIETQTAADLLRTADQRLYRAKRRGRNRVKPAPAAAPQQRVELPALARNITPRGPKAELTVIPAAL
jgi:diguanylate cyclase (GGDEF)-like protein